MKVGSSPANRSERSAPDIYEGQFPARYTLRQQLRQWSPQVNRITSFEPGEEASKISWEAVRTWLAQGATSSGESNDAVFAVSKGTLKLLISPRNGSVPVSHDLIRQLCVGSPDPAGLFTVIEQLSPNGADNFNDLMLPAAIEGSRAVVVIARREGTGVHLFRRLFDR